MDPTADVERLTAIVQEIGERASADPAYRESLKANQIEALREAGASAVVLGGMLEELGAEAEEVEAFGLSLTGSGEGTAIIVSGTCIGTCRKQTFQVCCHNSFAAARGGGAQAGGAQAGGIAGA